MDFELVAKKEIKPTDIITRTTEYFDKPVQKTQTYESCASILDMMRCGSVKKANENKSSNDV